MQPGSHSSISEPSTAAVTMPTGTPSFPCSSLAKKNPIAEHFPAVADDATCQEFWLSCHSKWFSVASMKRIVG